MTLGNLTNKEELKRALRVNHAGEYGAKQIYSGQLAVFRNRKDEEMVKLIEHMNEQEEVHFDYFDKKIVEEKVRPTIMQPIWKVGGFALGAVTALMGKKAAMACTVAVEEVIDEHYQEQLKNLKGEESLKENIEKFRQEELEHRDIGLENDAEGLALYKPLTFAIKKLSKLAIFTSTRI